MFFKKGNSGGLFQKGSQLLHHGMKGVRDVASLADNPLFAPALATVAPELLPAYGAIKASGVLQRLKH